jgi:hypothetical protein
MTRMSVSFLAVIALTITSLETSFARGRTESAPVWTIDLSIDPDFIKRAHAENPTLLRPPILDFLDEGHIIVAFDDNSSALSGLEMRPFGFHVLKVDAAAGELGRKLSWQVQNHTSQAVSVEKSNFLVLVGEHLKVVSNKFEELGSIPVLLRLHGKPTPMHLASGLFLNQDFDRWQMDVAPGGATVCLAHYEGPDVTVKWLRSSNLGQFGSATFSGAGLKDLSAGNESALIFVHTLSPMLLTRSGEHRTLVEYRPGMARVLTDDLIFLAMRTKYKIVTTSGEVRSSGKLKIGAYQFCRSSGADRFAFTTGFYKGSGFPLQTEFAPQMTVHIFDAKTLKQVTEKTFHEPAVPAGGSSHGFRQSAIALSPDGHRLLVLINSRLSLYRIP